MKKLFLFVLGLLMFFSLDIYIKYEMYPYEYLKYSLPISNEEKDWLNENGGITYGADMTAYPLSFFNSDSNQLEGVLVDYFAHLSIENGIQVTPVALNWSELIDSLDKGSIMTADLFISEERMKLFDFTKPIYTLDGNIVTLKNNQKVCNIENLKNEKIAIVEDDYSKEYLLNNHEWKQELLVETENISIAMDLLNSGDVKAVVGDAAVLETYILGSDNSGKYIMSEDPIYTMPVCFAVKKDSDILLSILNKCVLQLKKDNIIQKTQEKWYGHATPVVRNAVRNSIILYIFIGIVLLLFFVNRWNYVLHKAIDTKTKEVENSKKNIKQIIDTMNLGILVVDKQDNIIEHNIWIENFEKRRRNELVGYPIIEFRKLYEIIAKYRKTSDKIIEYDNLYYEVTIRPVNYISGEKELIVIDDITKKITDEKILRQQSKMIAIGHLSAGLAHEIRNPLGVIKSYLFYIDRNISGNQLKTAVSECDTSVRRIDRLITTLLNFSKSNKNSTEIVDLQNLIISIAELEYKEAMKFGIIVRYNCNPITLSCDEESLKVILINLVENAIEALKTQHQEVKEVVISAIGDGTVLKLQVSDNGMQIEEEVREHIFDPFFTTKETGTGLGLYLVNNEVNKIGGTITLSCSEAGNTFDIMIPLDERQKGDDLSVSM